MKDWLQKNRAWAALNLAALTVMASVLWRLWAIASGQRDFNRLLAVSGIWAIRFLLLSLLMTPLNTLLGWRGANKLRKPAGLWAFAFAVLHFLLNIAGTTENWLQYPIPDYLAGLGVIALSILTPMAATSFKWAMKHLGRWWKRLHRLVYAAGLFGLSHALLEAPNKRVAAYGSPTDFELWGYLVLWVALLLVRVPAVRVAFANRKRK